MSFPDAVFNGLFRRETLCKPRANDNNTIKEFGRRFRPRGVCLVSKRFFGVSAFFNYAIADGFYNLLFPDQTDIKEMLNAKKLEFQLSFNFWEECGKQKPGNSRLFFFLTTFSLVVYRTTIENTGRSVCSIECAIEDMEYKQ
jgi:hypothetical protein